MGPGGGGATRPYLPFLMKRAVGYIDIRKNDNMEIIKLKSW